MPKSVLLCLLLPIIAQAQLTLRPTTIIGVSLVPPSPSLIAQAGPAGQYLAAIANNGAMSIDAIVVRYEIGAPPASTIHRIRVLEDLNLLPGQSRTVSPSSSDLRAFVGKQVIASLDGIIFGDGTFAGPDITQLYPRMAARNQAAAAFWSGVKEHASDPVKLREWLVNEIAESDPRTHPHTSIETTDLAGTRRWKYAQVALKMLDDGRLSDLLRLADKEQQAQKPTLRRGQ